MLEGKRIHHIDFSKPLSENDKQWLCLLVNSNRRRVITGNYECNKILPWKEPKKSPNETDNERVYELKRNGGNPEYATFSDSVIEYKFPEGNSIFFVVPKKARERNFEKNPDNQKVVKPVLLAFVIKNGNQFEQLKGEYVYERDKRNVSLLVEEGMQQFAQECEKRQKEISQEQLEKHRPAVREHIKNKFKKTARDNVKIIQELFSNDKCINPGFEYNADNDTYVSRSFPLNQGVDVHSYIERQKEQKLWSLGGALALCLELAYAVQKVHGKNYAHRDIKYNNILVNLKTRKARCIDFERICKEGEQVLGYYNNFSPPNSFCYTMKNSEQTKRIYGDTSHLLRRDDIYNLGLIMLKAMVSLDQTGKAKNIYDEYVSNVRKYLFPLKQENSATSEPWSDKTVKINHKWVIEDLHCKIDEIFKLIEPSFSDPLVLTKMQNLLKDMTQQYPKDRYDIGQVVKTCGGVLFAAKRRAERSWDKLVKNIPGKRELFGIKLKKTDFEKKLTKKHAEFKKSVMEKTDDAEIRDAYQKQADQYDCDRVINFAQEMIKQYQTKPLLHRILGWFKKGKSARDEMAENLLQSLKVQSTFNDVLICINKAIYDSTKQDLTTYEGKWDDQRISEFRQMLVIMKKRLFSRCPVNQRKILLETERVHTLNVANHIVEKTKINLTQGVKESLEVQGDTYKITAALRSVSKDEHFKKYYKSGWLARELFSEKLGVIFQGEKSKLENEIRLKAKQEKTEQLRSHMFRSLVRR